MFIPANPPAPVGAKALPEALTASQLWLEGASFYAGKMHDGLKTYLNLYSICALLATVLFCPGFCGDKYDVKQNVLPAMGQLWYLDIFYLQWALTVRQMLSQGRVWFQQSTATVDACRRLAPRTLLELQAKICIQCALGSQRLRRRSTCVHSLERRPSSPVAQRLRFAKAGHAETFSTGGIVPP